MSNAGSADKERGITIAAIRGRLGRLAEAYREDGIRLASLFGSILEGRTAHDVDVAVLFRDYNLIELAGEKGLLTPDFAHNIRGMAGMRNAIVHVYWRMDYEAIYQSITQDLGDFDEFARQVQTYLRNQEQRRKDR